MSGLLLKSTFIQSVAVVTRAQPVHKSCSQLLESVEVEL